MPNRKIQCAILFGKMYSAFEFLLNLVKSNTTRFYLKFSRKIGMKNIHFDFFKIIFAQKILLSIKRLTYTRAAPY